MPRKHTFSAYWTDKLGEAIKKCAKAQCPEGYSMEFHRSGNDFKAFERAVDEGIDAHLEAIRFDQRMGEHGRFRFVVSPDTLHVLVRRLMECSGDEVLQDEALSLASDICSTLDIELV